MSEQEVRDALKRYEEQYVRAEHAESRAVAVERERDVAIEAFRKYGAHRVPCTGGHDCICGFDAALREGTEAPFDVEAPSPNPRDWQKWEEQ